MIVFYSSFNVKLCVLGFQLISKKRIYRLYKITFEETKNKIYINKLAYFNKPYGRFVVGLNYMEAIHGETFQV